MTGTSRIPRFFMSANTTRYYTMYLSLTDNPPDGPDIKAWLMQPRPGDITIPAR